VSKRTLKNLIILVIIVVAVVALSSLQRASKAKSLAQDLTQKDAYQAYKSMKKLAALGPSAMGNVVPLLRSADGEVRARALMLIGETGAQRYAPIVVRFLDDPAPDARIAAAVALGSLGDKDAAPQLQKLAMASDAPQPLDVRAAATRSLARLALPESLPTFVALLQLPATKANAPLREAAIVALGALHTPEAVTQLIQRLPAAAEKDPQVRALAAQGLAYAAQAGPDATDQAGQALLSGLAGPQQDPDSAVRIACAHSLAGMRFSGALYDQVQDALQTAQNDPHFWVRRAARESQ
jgi:HEAT repeat protein